MEVQMRAARGELPLRGELARGMAVQWTGSGLDIFQEADTMSAFTPNPEIAIVKVE